MSEVQFYLGRRYDLAGDRALAGRLEYDPSDLTTHAVVTGMTGSGKTGLCVAMLEEAALAGIPALVIDPKGDLTNLLLHFPSLAPQDFEPWIDTEVARRSGRSQAQVAEQAARSWREGLGAWDIPPERVRDLRNAAGYAVYTPGSDAGMKVSLLSSLAAPGIAWDANRELLRERIASTVTALLGLVGFEDLDPLSSREHILLANIFEQAWSQGTDLDLTELILQTQSPPFETLGAFAVETFFPAKARKALAMKINNILASPVFEAWREGESLDIAALLAAPDGRPRHTVFYLAHLSEPERMFFVTLLLTAVETWMRTQPGVSALRAILYMDELFGYLPPTANPPSKGPLLRLLKQARAFGLGLLLATQNPVDLDYKALSNAGTWFIGKLQTERDKARLLDGLESAAGDVPRGEIDRLISSLRKRVFLLHNVHAAHPLVFQTRWTMNFLAGPLTRSQIPALNALAGAQPPGRVAGAPAASPGAAPLSGGRADGPHPAPAAAAVGSQTRPAVPAGVDEYFLPASLGPTRALETAGRPAVPGEPAGLTYRPALLAGARVRFLDRKHGVEAQVLRVVLAPPAELAGSLRWEAHLLGDLPEDRVERLPDPGARFSALGEPFSDRQRMNALKREFVDWIYHSTTVTARANEALKVYAGPDVSLGEFMRACADSARQGRDEELRSREAQFERRLRTLKDRLAREQRELKDDQVELSLRRTEEVGTHVENVLGVFGGRRSSRRLSTSLTKRRMTEQARADVEESLDTLEGLQAQLQALEQERERTLEEINDRWGDLVNDVSEVTITPRKTDIHVTWFGLAWVPHYLFEADGQAVEIPAFGPDPR